MIAPWILQFHGIVLSGVLWEGQDNRGLLLAHIVVIPTTESQAHDTNSCARNRIK